MTTTEVTGNRFSPDASAFRRGEFTDAHGQALAILSRNNVFYLGEELIRVWGEWDSKGHPVRYKADILIDDIDYGSGVVHIDGSIHEKLRQEKKDERQDRRLERMGLWVERVKNEDVSSIMEVLAKHKRQRDEYSG